MSCLTCTIQNPCRPAARTPPAPSSPTEDSKTTLIRDSGFEIRINTQETEVTQRHVITPRGMSVASCQAPPLLVDLGFISSLLENGRRSQVRLDLRNGERCMLACSSESERRFGPHYTGPQLEWGLVGRGRRHIWTFAFLCMCGSPGITSAPWKQPLSKDLQDLQDLLYPHAGNQGS